MIAKEEKSLNGSSLGGTCLKAILKAKGFSFAMVKRRKETCC
jgi:hypothetical protein